MITKIDIKKWILLTQLLFNRGSYAIIWIRSSQLLFWYVSEGFGSKGTKRMLHLLKEPLSTEKYV